MEKQRLLESQAHLEGRDSQVVQVLMAKMEQQGLMERQDHLDLLDHQVMMAFMENLVLLAMRVLQESLVKMVTMVRKEK